MQAKQRRMGARRRRDMVSGRRIALTMLLIVSLLVSNISVIVSPAAVWAASDPQAPPAATPEPDLTPSATSEPQNTPDPQPTPQNTAETCPHSRTTSHT